MTRSTRLYSLFFCCGLCVGCALALGLWLFLLGWLDAVHSPSAPTQVAPIVKGAEMRPPSAPTQVAAVVDQNTHLVERNAFYQNLPAQDIPNKRLEDQAKLLETYEKDPEAFLEEYTGTGPARTFLFDAVIDAKNMVRVGTFGDGGTATTLPG